MRDTALNRIARELQPRPPEGGPGVDLTAEPWAIGEGTYQVGGFPAGWSEWNGAFRDILRKSQNKLGIEAVTPGQFSDAAFWLVRSVLQQRTSLGPSQARCRESDCEESAKIA